MEAESQNKPLLLKPLRCNFNFIVLLYIQRICLGITFPVGSNPTLDLGLDLVLSFSECHIVHF